MKKLKDPAFLFYPEAFMVGTMDMSDEDVGRYIRLLCRQFIKGHLTSLGNASDDVKEKFIQDEDGLFYNERLEFEIAKRKEYAESRRRNGAKGGRPKKENHMETICKEGDEEQENHMQKKQKPYANHVPLKKNHTINTNTNINTDINLNNKQEIRNGKYDIPSAEEVEQRMTGIRGRIAEVNRKWGFTHE